MGRPVRQAHARPDRGAPRRADARTRYRVYDGTLTRREVFYDQPSPLASVTVVSTPYGPRWVSDRDPYGPSWTDADEALAHVVERLAWDAC